MKREELENYIPKGKLEGFPKEIIARMLYCQEEQGYPRNVSIFEKIVVAGFIWNETKEGSYFWHEVINNKDFNLFFEKYPKKDNSQEFRVGDEVIDIITRQRGKILEINTNDGSNYPIYVSVNKYPRLLHYRDDYNYDVIDFNNLPKRQEPKRWRAGKEGVYYFICFQIEGWFYTSSTKENHSYYDNINYNSGNYFLTEVEAEIIAQKLNTYFKQLIQEEHEHERN